MFGYRHSFHAGNFADVCKHVTLTVLLNALQRKETPLFFLDTHAAIGRYDLASEQALKTGEYHDGIGRLWGLREGPAEVLDYLGVVGAFNAGELRWYPGSPRIARHLLRGQDRMALTELNRTDHETLRQEFAGDPQVAVHLHDAYLGLKAFLPPKERRGLVLIDPAFEQEEEYHRLVEGLTTALGRWPTGMYAIWYPILTRGLAERFHTMVVATGVRKVLRVELTVRPPVERHRLNGSGLLIINPPWQLDQRLTEVFDWLRERLEEPGQGGSRVDWLVPE